MKTGTKVFLILCVIGLAGAMAGAVTWYVKQKQCEGSDFRTDEGNAGLHWKKFGRSQAVVK